MRTSACKILMADTCTYISATYSSYNFLYLSLCMVCYTTRLPAGAHVLRPVCTPAMEVERTSMM